MPYISREARGELAHQGRLPETPGELNYAITLLLDTYLRTKGLSYGTINDILGALEGCKLELYRRVAVPLENLKLVQNGDVYTKVT